MTGKDEEYRAVEAYVNLLEDKYTPVQTIDFLNLAMAGDWQLVSRYFRMIMTWQYSLRSHSILLIEISQVVFNESYRFFKQKIAFERVVAEDRINRIQWKFNQCGAMGRG
jgi:hypothetical protein